MHRRDRERESLATSSDTLSTPWGWREGGGNERANTPRRTEEWEEEGNTRVEEERNRKRELIERNAGMLFVCLAQMMTVQCVCY